MLEPMNLPRFPSFSLPNPCNILVSTISNIQIKRKRREKKLNYRQLKLKQKDINKKLNSKTIIIVP